MCGCLACQTGSTGRAVHRQSQCICTLPLNGKGGGLYNKLMYRSQLLRDTAAVGSGSLSTSPQPTWDSDSAESLRLARVPESLLARPRDGEASECFAVLFSIT